MEFVTVKDQEATRLGLFSATDTVVDALTELAALFPGFKFVPQILMEVLVLFALVAVVDAPLFSRSVGLILPLLLCQGEYCALPRPPAGMVLSQIAAGDTVRMHRQRVQETHEQQQQQQQQQPQPQQPQFVFNPVFSPSFNPNFNPSHNINAGNATGATDSGSSTARRPLPPSTAAAKWLLNHDIRVMAARMQEKQRVVVVDDDNEEDVEKVGEKKKKNEKQLKKRKQEEEEDEDLDYQWIEQQSVSIEAEWARRHTPQDVRSWRMLLQQAGMQPFRQYTESTSAQGLLAELYSQSAFLTLLLLIAVR